jgi:membrane protein required for colicin V production
MNAIDIVILVPVLWGFWRGFMKGAIMEAAMFAAFFLGVWGGLHLSDKAADLIHEWTGSESAYIPLISFALVFVLILIGVFAIAKLVERVAEGAALGIVNKLLGGVFGSLKYLLLLSVLFFVIDSVSKKMEIVPEKMKEGSLLYKPVASIAPLIIPGISKTDFGEIIPDKEDVEVDVNVKLKDSLK